MNNLNFNEGYKEFTINNNPNRVIRFNPTDVGFVERFEVASKALEGLAERISEEESDASAIAKIDAEIARTEAKKEKQ